MNTLFVNLLLGITLKSGKCIGRHQQLGPELALRQRGHVLVQEFCSPDLSLDMKPLDLRTMEYNRKYRK